MLIQIAIVVFTVQFLSVLLTGFFGIYNTLLMISQFSIQSTISLISFLCLLVYFLVSKNIKEKHNVNLIWFLSSLLLTSANLFGIVYSQNVLES